MLQNAMYDSSNATNGIIVQYDCLPGYAMIGMVRQVFLECRNESWNDTGFPEACEGEVLRTNFVFLDRSPGR